MNLFLWIALAAFALVALPCALYFVAFVVTGEELHRAKARRLYRWASLVALVTFNITIFKHVVLTIAAL